MIWMIGRKDVKRTCGGKAVMMMMMMVVMMRRILLVVRGGCGGIALRPMPKKSKIPQKLMDTWQLGVCKGWLHKMTP